MAQAKTGGLSCGWVEPTHGEGLYWGDESREQGASACKLARAFGKSADSLGGANECRALLTVLYPGSGRSLAASCPSCPCEMWKINRLEGADGSKHTDPHTHKNTIKCPHTFTSVHASISTHITMHTRTNSRTHRLTQTSTPTLRPGSLRYHIMRAPARPSHEASAEMIQDSPLGRPSVSQVELHTRMTAQLWHYAKCGSAFVLIRVCGWRMHTGQMVVDQFHFVCSVRLSDSVLLYDRNSCLLKEWEKMKVFIA